MSNMEDTLRNEPVDDSTEEHIPAAGNGEPTLPSTKPVPPIEDEPTRAALQSVPDSDEELDLQLSQPVGTSKGTGIPKVVVFGGVALVAVLALAAVVTAVVLSAGGRRLTASNPSISHPDGITVSLVGEGALSADLDSLPRELFLQQQAGEEYAAAQAAIPAYLEMKSPLYTVDISGDGASSIQIVIPNESQPYETLDLYTWDAEAGEWRFVPGHVDHATETFQTDERPVNLAVFQTRPVTPLITTIVESGNMLDDETSSMLNMVYTTGLRVRADGALEGSLIGGWQVGKGYAVVPVIYADDAAILSELLNNQASLALHIEDLSAFVIGDGYSGIALDYRNIDLQDRAAYVSFVDKLAARLDEYNKLVVVFLPRPNSASGPWDTGSYDWRGLGAAADFVVIEPSSDPASYGTDGESMALLRWAVGEVSRLKIQMASSSLSVMQSNGVFSLLSYEEALAGFGNVTINTSLPEGAGAYQPDTTLTFNLSGDFTDLAADPVSGAYTYALDSDARYWIINASVVRARLDMAYRYHIGGMVIADMLDAGNDAALITAINEFKVKTISTAPYELLLEWHVVGASGAVLSQASGVGTPLIWQAAEAGDFTVGAEIIGRQRISRGSVGVQIGAPAESPTPTTPPPPARPSGSSHNPPAPPSAPTTPQPTVIPTAPPSTGGAGHPGGGFELGGQVPSSLGPAPYLQAAGMNWVKFQAKWPYVDAGTACSYVSSGRAAGFKVLLSIPGPLYPSSIDFASYTNHLAAVASCQPDAVEIWNEMNLDREWPAGQIDPASYVNNMLAPGFNAIKSASPGTIVIIGALAPTGFDNGTNAWSDQRYLQGLAAAGAANYANCVGAHHNSGTTSPSVRSGRSEGDHYSWYFLPTLEVTYYAMGASLPVCLTEFGYLTPEGYGALPPAFAWGGDNTVAEQAAWLKEGADIARGLGWVRMMIIWNVGFTQWDSDPQAGYSIVRPDGSCPACDLLP